MRTVTAEEYKKLASGASLKWDGTPPPPPTLDVWGPREWFIARVPTTANKALRSHWSVRRADLKDWKDRLESATFPGGPFRHRKDGRASPAKVGLRILMIRRRGGRRTAALQDPDNRVASVKPVLDALKHRGWIWDDSSTWLDLEVDEKAAGLDRTVIHWRLIPTTQEEVPVSRPKTTKAKSPAKRTKSKKAKGPKILERVVTVHGVHLNQALAFVQVCLKAGAVKSHLEAALGLGNVANVKDFESHDGDAQGRADAFVRYMELVSHQLDVRLRENPRQLEIVKEAVTPKEPEAPKAEEKPLAAAEAATA